MKKTEKKPSKGKKFTGGAGTGVGRLEKARNAKAKGKGKKDETY